MLIRFIFIENMVDGLVTVQFINSTRKACWFIASLTSLMFSMRSLQPDLVRRIDLPDIQMDIVTALSLWAFTDKPFIIDVRKLLANFAMKYCIASEMRHVTNDYQEADMVFTNLLKNHQLEFMQPNLLHGFKRSACLCTKASSMEYQSPERLAILHLHFPGNGLQKALDHFFDHIHQNVCSTCLRDYQQTNVSRMIEVAKLLVLRIERASMENGSITTNSQDVDFDGTYSVPILGGEKKMYQCVAAVEHKDSITSGHFVSHMKNKRNLVWYTIDDDKPLTKSTTYKKSYLLFMNHISFA